MTCEPCWIKCWAPLSHIWAPAALTSDDESKCYLYTKHMKQKLNFKTPTIMKVIYYLLRMGRRPALPEIAGSGQAVFKVMAGAVGLLFSQTT